MWRNDPRLFLFLQSFVCEWATLLIVHKKYVTQKVTEVRLFNNLKYFMSYLFTETGPLYMLISLEYLFIFVKLLGFNFVSFF